MCVCARASTCLQLDECDVALHRADGVFVDRRGTPQLCDRLESKLWRDPSRVQSVIASLDNMLTCTQHLYSMLLPIEPECGSYRGNTMAHELLSTPALQAKVATYLAELMPNTSNDGPITPQAVLSQFRWVEVLKDPASVVRALLDVQEVCSNDLRAQVLSFIPELASPAEHQKVVSTCISMLHDDPSFAPAVLECLDGLDLSEALRSSATSAILNRLPHMSTAQVAQATRLLLQSSRSDDEASQFIGTLRGVLERKRSSSGNMKGKAAAKQAVSRDTGDDLVEALASSLHLNQRCRKAYIGVMKSITHATQFLPLDLWAIFILADSEGSKQNASRDAMHLAKRHLPALPGSCSDKLRSALHLHSSSIANHRRGILRTANWLASSSVCTESLTLYYEVFQQSAGPGQREEVLGELVTRALSSELQSEAALACKALEYLATADPSGVEDHRSTIVNLLEASETLPTHLQPPLMGTFAALAVHEIEEEQSNPPVLSDLQRLLHKGLPSPKAERRHVAITGAVCLLEKLGLSACLSSNGDGAKVADSIISLLKTHCMHTAGSTCHEVSNGESLLADQIACVSERVGLRMSEWMRAKLWETFVTRLEESSVLEQPIAEAAGDLDSEGEHSAQEGHKRGWVCLDNSEQTDSADCEIELLLDPRSGGLGSASAAYLRVSVALSETKHHGNGASEVNALLICPLRLADPYLTPPASPAHTSIRKTTANKRKENREPTEKQNQKKQKHDNERLHSLGEIPANENVHDNGDNTEPEDETEEDCANHTCGHSGEQEPPAVAEDVSDHAIWTLSMFYAIQWIREAITSFSRPAALGSLQMSCLERSDGSDIVYAQSKLLKRLRQHLQLEALLDSSSPGPCSFPDQSYTESGEAKIALMQKSFPNTLSTSTASKDWRLCLRKMRFQILLILSAAANERKLVDCLSAATPLLRAAAAWSDAHLQMNDGAKGEQQEPQQKANEEQAKSLSQSANYGAELLDIISNEIPSIISVLTRSSTYLAWRADKSVPEAQHDTRDADSLESTTHEQHQLPPGAYDLSTLSDTAAKACSNVTELAARCRALSLRILRNVLPLNHVGDPSLCKERFSKIRGVCDNMVYGGVFDPTAAADATVAMDAIVRNYSNRQTLGAEHQNDVNNAMRDKLALQLREELCEASSAFLMCSPAAETHAPSPVTRMRAQNLTRQDVEAERVKPISGQPAHRKVTRGELGRCLKQLLSISVHNASNPLERLHKLCTEHITQVGTQGNEDMQCLRPDTAAMLAAGLHSLIQQEVQKLVLDASKAIPSISGSTVQPTGVDDTGGGTAVTSQARPHQHVKAKAPLPPKSTMDSLMVRASLCASAFRGVTTVASVQRDRIDVLSCTLREGRKTLSVLMDIFPLLENDTRASQSEGAPHVKEVLEGVRKGMKCMQQVVEEARTKRDSSLLSCVPPAKRALETYLLRSEELFKTARSHGLEVESEVGTLKHRDLAGKILPSQLAEPVEEDSDGG